MFANIYLYLPLIFSNGVKRHVVEYDKLRFQPEIICNAVCEECLQNLFIFTPYFAIGEKRHVVEYDKLRFQPEIICNAVCEECLQISIYIYPLFSQMVSHDMLLSMINSDFSLKSFVMLYVKNVCKYLFIFTPYFLKLVSHDMLLSMINSDFSQKSFVNVKNFAKISIYI